MQAFSGTKYAIEFFAESQEAVQFQWMLSISLKNAGWIPILHDSHPGRRFNLGFGICILTVADENCISRSRAGDALAGWLDGNEVATITAVVARNDLEPHYSDYSGRAKA